MTILKAPKFAAIDHAARSQQRDTLLDYEALAELSRSSGEQYRGGQPFPHIMFDDFLAKDVFEEVVAALPAYEERQGFLNFKANLADGRPAQAGKFHLSDITQMAPIIRQLIHELNSGPFLAFVERLTGIKGLLPDPQLQGGGIHMTGRGGLLRVHADFNMHKFYKFDRRVNLLLYCNPGWQEEYGGHLELWPSDMSACARRILPAGNRCVLFNTTSESFHGQPQPLTCPEGDARKSIALYYYTVGRPAHESRPAHETLWQTLPSEPSVSKTPPAPATGKRPKAIKRIRKAIGGWIAGK